MKAMVQGADLATIPVVLQSRTQNHFPRIRDRVELYETTGNRDDDEDKRASAPQNVASKRPAIPDFDEREAKRRRSG